MLVPEHSDPIGILLLNLGGPDSLQAVKPFLYNLFSDREIIKLGPAFLQKPLARLISDLRSKKVEKMYSLIGGKSPLLDITMAQAEALEKALNKKSEVKNSSLVTRHSSLSFKVYIAMRYWHPFISDTVKEIIKDGVKHLVVASLYPHYSRATTGSAISEFKRVVTRLMPHVSRLTIQYIEQWYDFPPYIEALAGLIHNGISKFNEDHSSPTPLPDTSGEGARGRVENVDILYSVHSLPQSFIDEGDPYLEQIKATITAINSSLVIEPALSLSKGHSSLVRWHLSFQSKTGPVKWLEPATDKTIIRLANEGCKNLFVVPISFVSDNIETLYEIDILYKEIAEKHGINFRRCEALNTSEKFIEVLKELVLTNVIPAEAGIQ
ncbi:MAG: ferrochelatase [Nitrospirae bacterium]|nr:ferrochelatase [Nitrospirota bacterium]